MINVPLQAIPNQNLSIQIDQINYNITLASCGSNFANADNSLYITAVTILINNTLVVSGVRAVAGFPIIASVYLENGNFVFVTNNGDYPNYLQFGIDQFLIYASPEELAQIEAGTFVVTV